MKAKRELSNEYKEFHSRFLSLIDLKGKKFWMEKLNAQASLIWGWQKGYVPSMEYVLKVCQLSGVSANWLFLGEGEKFLNDIDPIPILSTENSLIEHEREAIQEEIYRSEKELKHLKINSLLEINRVKKDAEILQLLKWSKEIFDPDVTSLSDINPIDIFTQILIPILKFFQSHGDKIIPVMEKYASSEEADELFTRFFNFISMIKRDSDGD